MSKGPLTGIKVIEFEGLAPTVFTGMILADFGADVTIINRLKNPNPISIDVNHTYLNRGKRSLAADLEDPFHVSVVKQLMSKADVVIDCFRPGKLEKLGLGPMQIDNQRLIFARLTGYGQTGPLKDLAGHDINYLSYSGILSTFGKATENHTFPNNILADFAGGGAFGVIGIMLALYERERTNKGQTVDVSLTDSVAYISSFLQNMKKIGAWNQPRGSNLLDGGAPFYQTYQCKDGKYLAVGCIEQQFFSRFVKGLGLNNTEELINSQFDQSQYPAVQAQFQQAFLTKSSTEWMDIFLPLDCCVSPVVNMDTLHHHPSLDKLIIKQSNSPHGYEYAPQPQLSRHQNKPKQFSNPPKRGQHTLEILHEYGIAEKDIHRFLTPNANL